MNEIHRFNSLLAELHEMERHRAEARQQAADVRDEALAQVQGAQHAYSRTITDVRNAADALSRADAPQTLAAAIATFEESVSSVDGETDRESAMNQMQPIMAARTALVASRTKVRARRRLRELGTLVVVVTLALVIALWGRPIAQSISSQATRLSTFVNEEIARLRADAARRPIERETERLYTSQAWCELVEYISQTNGTGLSPDMVDPILTEALCGCVHDYLNAGDLAAARSVISWGEQVDIIQDEAQAFARTVQRYEQAVEMIADERYADANHVLLLIPTDQREAAWYKALRAQAAGKK